ncbi:MAG: carbon storage regulator [Planctomycetaceae bacterium]|jgi:carbon storage regulator|nr:carbon storage regulator [Planctomycetaceae bacterium]
MLVLNRKKGEVIRIGDDIIIKILDTHNIKDGKIRIAVGIDAPEGVPVLREELYDQREGVGSRTASGWKDCPTLSNEK